MTPSRASFGAIFTRCGIELERAPLDLLWEYHQLLRIANEGLNLTRIHNFENMVLKHYVDSLLVLRFEEPEGLLVDMGSGPGLPGIPLAINRPDTKMILAEPRRTRAEFLDHVIAELDLQNVEVYAGSVGPRFPRQAGSVITRAVASIPKTLDQVAGVLGPGGRMLFMKGPDCDREVEAANHSHASSFRLAADHHYAIPGTPHQRRLVVYERIESDERPFVPYHSAISVREVTSEANPTFKMARDLQMGRGIRKHGQAILAGRKIVTEVLEKFPDRAEAWLTGPEGAETPRASLPWLRLSAPLFRELDVSGTNSPLLLVRVPEMSVWSASDPWPDGCTLFVPFQDPENVGTVLRSAAAFGVARAVLLREAAHPFHPKAARAAGPALFQVPLLYGPALKDLSSSDCPLIALATDGPDLLEEPFPARFGLVPGLEGPGLPPGLRSALRRRIPIAPGVESLNAATATAIALFAWSRGLSLACPVSRRP